MKVSRRTVLQAATASAALLATGCTTAHGAARASTRPAVAARAGGPGAADWRALERAIDGAVVRRNDRDFTEAKRLFDPRFDHVRPLAVIEAADTHDVVEAIRFARRFDLP